MQRRDLLIFVFVQLVVVFCVILIFKLIEEKSLAGVVAGLLFVTSTSYLLYRASILNKPTQTWTFWSTLFFLFVVAIPMLVQRVRFINTEFSDILIWGLSGPEFHRLSEKIYLFIALSAVIDYVRARIFLPPKSHLPKIHYRRIDT